MGGKLIGLNTIDNISDITKPLANSGQIYFLSTNDFCNLLTDVGFKNIITDKVIRSYNNQEFQMEYLVIKASK